MVHVADAVDDRVAHIEVAGGEVDLRAERAAALGEFAVFHALEQVEIFLDAAVAVRGFCGRADVAAVFLRLLGRQVADVGEALFDQFNRKLVVLFKIIAAVEEPVAPVEAQPVDIGLNGVDILGIFLRGVGVVHAEVAEAAELFGRAEVDGQGLAVADMQVSVRLRREPGVDLFPLKAAARGEILFYKVIDEILVFDRSDVFHASSSFCVCTN